MSAPQSPADIASRHHASLFRWALALSRGDRFEAEEIVQQVYVEVIEGRADLPAAKDARAFLFGVARRIAASRRRRQSVWGRIMRLDFDRIDRPSGPPDPEEEIVGGERAARAREALASLGGRQRQVAALVFGEGLTVEEAASAMRVSLGSARTHYHRAKLKLARFLEDDDAVAGRTVEAAVP
jgi:RNA polymerase sigma factor (sigma-70 family)